MVNRNTIMKRISVETEKEIKRIQQIISKELGIPIDKITFRQAEAVFRLKASRGKVLNGEIRNILLGKLKVN